LSSSSHQRGRGKDGVWREDGRRREGSGPEVRDILGSPKRGSAPPGAGHGEGKRRERPDAGPGGAEQGPLMARTGFDLFVGKSQLCWFPPATAVPGWAGTLWHPGPAGSGAGSVEGAEQVV